MRWLLLLCCTMPAVAHDPITTNLTWANEISRLVQRHCSGCHQSGGQAMPLNTYEQARPWAKAIRDEVLSRRMPPWDAVKGVGDFRNDRSLSQPELDMVVRWVEGGAPEGEAAASGVLNTPPPVPASTTRAPDGLRVVKTIQLRRAMRLTGIWVECAAEVAALLPDQSVERLLWIRTFRERWNRVYWLRTPEVLPRGTTILVHSPTGAAARLLTISAPAK